MTVCPPVGAEDALAAHVEVVSVDQAEDLVSAGAKIGHVSLREWRYMAV